VETGVEQAWPEFDTQAVVAVVWEWMAANEVAHAVENCLAGEGQTPFERHAVYVQIPRVSTFHQSPAEICTRARCVKLSG